MPEQNSNQNISNNNAGRGLHEGGSSWRSYLMLFLQHKITFLCSLAVAMLIATVVFYYYPRKYYHFGLVKINPDRSQYTRRFIFKDNSIFANFDYKRTEAERMVMLSHTTLETAIRAMKGHISYRVDPSWLRDGKVVYEYRPFTIVEPQGKVLPPCVIDFSISDDAASYTWSLDGEQERVGHWGDSITIGDITCRIDAYQDMVPHYAGRTIRVRVIEIEQAVQWLSKNIEVEHPGNISTILAVEVPAETPVLCDTYNNAVMLSFVRALEKHRKTSLRNAVDLMGELLEDVTADLNHIEEEMHRWKVANAHNNSVTIQKSILGRPNDIRKRFRQLTDSATCVSYIEMLESESDSVRSLPVSYALGQMLPTLVSTIKNYNMNILKREKLLQGASESHPEVKMLDERLQSQRQTILYTLRQHLEQTQARMAGADERLRKGYVMFDNLYRDETPITLYTDLQRTKQYLYRFLSKQRVTAEIELHSMKPDAEIAQFSCGDDQFRNPPRKMIFGLALLAGLILPFFFIKIAEMLRITPLTPLLLSKVLPEYSCIGALPRRVRRHQEEDEDSLTRASSVVAGNLMTVIQAYRYREQVPAGQGSVVLLSSLHTGEGRSFSARQLAFGLSDLGQKVLLIDGDMRRAKLSGMLRSRQKQGLSDLLSSRNISVEELQDMVVEVYSDEKNLVSFLPSGVMPPNPTEIIGSVQMQQVFGVARQLYDYVLVDAAPVEAVADARVLGPSADVFCFVLRSGVSTTSSFPVIREVVEQDGLHDVIVMLNGVKQKHASDYR